MGSLLVDPEMAPARRRRRGILIQTHLFAIHLVASRSSLRPSPCSSEAPRGGRGWGHVTRIRAFVLVRMIREIFLLSRPGNGKFRYSGFPAHSYYLPESRYVECLSGCNMAYGREVFDAVRFDENLGTYTVWKDVDISMQVKHAGYKSYYVASARLQHNQSPAGRHAEYEDARRLVTDYDYVFRKHWPQTLLRRVVFWWSVLGLGVLNRRNVERLRGTLAGASPLIVRRWKR